MGYPIEVHASIVLFLISFTGCGLFLWFDARSEYNQQLERHVFSLAPIIVQTLGMMITFVGIVIGGVYLNWLSDLHLWGRLSEKVALPEELLRRDLFSALGVGAFLLASYQLWYREDRGKARSRWNLWFLLWLALIIVLYFSLPPLVREWWR